MSNIPSGSEVRHAATNGCARWRTATLEIGISDHAQHALGDLVFVEVPEIGRSLNAGEACAVVESVKAASDVYAPVAGTVIAVNDQLRHTPEADQHRSVRRRLAAAAAARARRRLRRRCCRRTSMAR